MKTSILFLVLLLAGCMDNSSSPYGGGGGGSTGGNPPPPNSFAMTSDSFVPSSMTVAKGTTVTWINSDAVVHTSTSDSSGLWNTGDIAPNARKTTTFNTAGTFHFHCIYHRAMGMVGTITVQ